MISTLDPVELVRLGPEEYTGYYHRRAGVPNRLDSLHLSSGHAPGLSHELLSVHQPRRTVLVFVFVTSYTN